MFTISLLLPGQAAVRQGYGADQGQEQVPLTEGPECQPCSIISGGTGSTQRRSQLFSLRSEIGLPSCGHKASILQIFHIKFEIKLNTLPTRKCKINQNGKTNKQNRKVPFRCSCSFDFLPIVNNLPKQIGK